MPARLETFRCMACGHEYQEKVDRGEDKERSCSRCRSNSIRHMKLRETTPRERPAPGD